MQRKLVKQGRNALTVTVPHTWIKKFGLKQGDDIDVAEEGNNVVLKTARGVHHEMCAIDVRGFQEKLIYQQLIGLYRYGYDEIEITYDLVAPIQKMVSALQGYAIIEQRKNVCMVKDLSGTPSTAFEPIFRRAFLILKSAIDEYESLMKEKRVMNTEDVKQIDRNFNNYVNYCLRYLNKHGHTDPKKTTIYYNLLLELEHMGDLFKVLVFDTKKKDDEFFKHWRIVRDIVEDLYSCVFNFKTETIKRLYAVLRKMNNELPTEKKPYLARIKGILELINNMVSGLFTVERPQ